MKLLEPVVQMIGRLSFRNKLRATALVFGIPLLAATSLLLMEINARVSALAQERAALAVQVPALALLSELHQLAAVSDGLQEGAGELEALLQGKRESSLQALQDLRAVAGEHGFWSGQTQAGDNWLGRWDSLATRIGEADARGVLELTGNLRTELDTLNGERGLISDGDVAGSRLLDVMTSHLPGLVETTGRASQIGTVVLIKKSLRGSRRSDLTLMRGNLDALVLWSLDNLRKVSADRPETTETLDAAGSQLNTAFSSLQEAITIKMLDTTDYAMTPQAYLAVSDKAFSETLAVGTLLVKAADSLLLGRMEILQLQRNLVVAAIVLTALFVLAGFLAAYISIMRGLNGLSDAVGTMAAGNLDARVAVSSQDELGEVGERFNEMAESLALRTAELREKTNDIHSMLQNLPQGILTIVGDARVHPEYSAYLETIFETGELAGASALNLVFGGSDIGADALSQLEASLAACIGEDAMNFEFNSHLLPAEVLKPMADGRRKALELTWAPICDENDVVDKIMLCVRDVSEIRQLLAESEHQKRELEMIGQILKVNQEKFHEFVDGARCFIAENEGLLHAAEVAEPELLTRLFRNMHTIKGNARTYGFLHLTNIVHAAEQAYAELRASPDARFDKAGLLRQLDEVDACLEDYAGLNEVKLGRKGPGRRASAEKYLMVHREQLETLIAQLDAYDLRACTRETLAAELAEIKLDLRRIGSDSVGNILEGVFASLPSLARELGKAAPTLLVVDHGVRIKNQAVGLLGNVFMHLYRNAMDHGIESPEERKSRGKAAAGTIRLELELLDDCLNMRLSDDGRGLALKHLRQRGLERGLIDESLAHDDAAVAKLIFAAGFSTASRVTEVSGRGVGMDAVQDFIKREGGSIQLQFVDDAAGADFRRFETVISLPARLAVNPMAAAIMHATPSGSHPSQGSAGGAARGADEFGPLLPNLGAA